MPVNQMTVVPTPLVLESKGIFAEHERRYHTSSIRPNRILVSRKQAQRLLGYREHYEAVEVKTGVPWFVVGCIHSMEASLSFAGCLHNGEKIIGTGKKTTLVPAGRGPFATWEESAINVLMDKDRWRPKAWSLGEILEFCERYNGPGYRKRGINTPYLWSFTTAYSSGFYVRDGKFSATAISGQVGVCAILKSLEILGVVRVDGDDLKRAA